jgi:hypothetical protein
VEYSTFAEDVQGRRWPVEARWAAGHRVLALCIALTVWVLGFWLLDSGYLRSSPVVQGVSVVAWSLLSAWIATRW